MDIVNLALVGFGNVGRAFAALISEKERRLRKATVLKLVSSLS